MTNVGQVDGPTAFIAYFNLIIHRGRRRRLYAISGNLVAAAAIAVAAAIAQFIRYRLTRRRIEPMQWLSLTLVVVARRTGSDNRCRRLCLVRVGGGARPRQPDHRPQLRFHHLGVVHLIRLGRRKAHGIPAAVRRVSRHHSYGACVHEFGTAKLRRGSRTFAHDQVRRRSSKIITMRSIADADRDGGRKLARLRRGCGAGMSPTR